MTPEERAYRAKSDRDAEHRRWLDNQIRHKAYEKAIRAVKETCKGRWVSVDDVVASLRRLAEGE